MVLGFITNVMLFLTFSLFGQATNILSNALSDDSLWWIAAIGLAMTAVFI